MECPYRKNDFCTQFNKTLELYPVNLYGQIHANQYIPCYACNKELMLEEEVDA
jgi:hypothetical protein